MKKNNIILSSLLLSHTLTNISPSLMAHSVIEVDAQGISLCKKLLINNQTYELYLLLKKNMIEEENEFNAQALLIVNGKVNIIGNYDSDGNMLFQMEKNDQENIFYKGLHCSSSFTNCEEFLKEEKFALIYNKLTNEWSINVKAYFSKSFFEYNGTLDKNN